MSRKKYIRRAFEDLAEEVLLECGPLPIAGIRDRVYSKTDITYIKNINSRQATMYLRADKRFTKINSVGHIRIPLWTVKELDSE